MLLPKAEVQKSLGFLTVSRQTEFLTWQTGYPRLGKKQSGSKAREVTVGNRENVGKRNTEDHEPKEQQQSRTYSNATI